jgi:hypothetical protein
MTRDYKKPIDETAEKVEAPEVETPVEVEVKTTRAAKVKDVLKKAHKVTAISKGNLFLSDEKGNGYKIRITEEYKKYKVGDTIVL